MTRKIYFIGMLLLVMFTNGCNLTGKPEKFDYGKVENNTYSNSFFNMKMSIPANWAIQSKEQVDNLSKEGKKLIAGEDSNMKAILDASDIKSANLLMAFQYELGTPVDYNSNLTIVAENLKFTPGIKKGSDYLFQARKLLVQSQIKYDSIDTEFEKETLGNKEFYKMNAKLTYAGVEIEQTYYSTIINGFSLGIIISYASDEQKKVLLNSINSIEFSK